MLGEEDVRRLHEAILDLHRPRTLPALRRVAPAIFKRVIPADYFIRLESGRDSLADLGGDAVLWDSPRRLSAALLRRAMECVAGHPFTEHVLRSGDLGPMRLSDYWSRERQLGSTIHREVYRHVGIGRLLSVGYVRGSRAGTVSLSRPPRARDFGERDREALRWLAPHLVLAITAAEALGSGWSGDSPALARLGLTARERLVAVWLARGRTNHEIAELLGSRPRTIEKHVEKILGKLGVENRTAVAGVILAAAGPASAPADGSVRPPSTREALGRVLRPARGPARR